MFGTFRDKLKESGTSYSGGSEEKVDKKSAATHDRKASLLGLPDPGFIVYLLLNSSVWLLLWFSVSRQHGIDSWSPHVLAFLTSVGPLILAQALDNITDRSKRSILYPFHKEGWKTMSGHLIVSFLVTILPVYVMVHMLLSKPGEAFYFWIR